MSEEPLHVYGAPPATDPPRPTPPPPDPGARPRLPLQGWETKSHLIGIVITPLHMVKQMHAKTGKERVEGWKDQTVIPLRQAMHLAPTHQVTRPLGVAHLLAVDLLVQVLNLTLPQNEEKAREALLEVRQILDKLELVPTVEPSGKVILKIEPGTEDAA